MAKRGVVDVVIAGAGPAGMSAALILGRARRRVLLCDTGTPRSWASKEMHGYLGRDCIPPTRFLEIARNEVLAYPGVRFAPVEVVEARRLRDGFLVELAGRKPVHARRLLVATGLFDLVPRIPGIDSLYGRTVFQCPYCDGWEMRDRKVAVYGHRQRGFEMSRAMTSWARDILLCTDGRSGFSATQRAELKANGITLTEKRVTRLEGARGRLLAVTFADGSRIARDVLFFDTPSRQQSALAKALGCRFDKDGGVECGDYEATNVPGVYVAGNITRDVQLSIVAAAEGARAAFGINRDLTREDFAARAMRTPRNGREEVLTVTC